MKTLPLLLLAATVAGPVVLVQTRYTIVAGGGGGRFPGAAYVLDRWTGRVRIVSLWGNETEPAPPAPPAQTRRLNADGLEILEPTP